MRKIVFFVSILASMGIACAQADTFDLNHMPENYHLENWPDSGGFIFSHYYASAVIGQNLLCIGVPICIGSRGYMQVYSSDFWNIPNIKNFAVGKHSDTPISITGIAFVYPRFKWSSGATGSIVSIRNEWISHGYDQLKLQLTDTSMNVLGEGTCPLADSIGKPVLLITNQREVLAIASTARYCIDNTGPIVFDIYEARFPAPVTVTDSFYLALHFESSIQDKEPLSLPVPGIYETVAIHSNLQRFSNYDFPKIEWIAQGSYRHRHEFWGDGSGEVAYDMVNDDDWFTYSACEENHGHMLIFPILETPCLVPTGLRWSPAGGGNVRLRWESGEWDTEWEVSYGLSGIAPEDGTIITATSNSAQLGGISTDTHYVAYVRTKCVVRDTLWSDWSGSIPIFISTQEIANVNKDDGIALQPNPASNSVLLTAEAPLSGIDVHTASGAFYKHLPASGLTADIDVSSWPAGTYLLRISTPAGTTTKKLLIQ